MQTQAPLETIGLVAPHADGGADDADLPVFQQTWWVEIAGSAAGRHEAQIRQNDVVVGRLPYITVRNKARLRWGVRPHWSQLGGPVVSRTLDQAGKADVLLRLVAQLPRTISYSIVCSPYSDDAALVRAAFLANGFRHSTQATFLQMPAPAPDIAQKMDRKHLGHIRRAARDLVLIDIGPKAFIDLYAADLARQGRTSHSPLDVAYRLIVGGLGRKPPQVLLLAAGRRGAGPPFGMESIDAAIAIAIDRQRAFLWMLTYRTADPQDGQDKPHPDGVKYLIVEAATYARSRALIFDTNGLFSAGSEHLYRKVLKIRTTEHRDVYERRTLSAQLYGVAKPLVKRALQLTNASL
jgi:hypothetical protein